MHEKTLLFYLKWSSWFSLLAIMCQNVGWSQSTAAITNCPTAKASTAPVGEPALDSYEMSFPAMGTLVQIIVYAGSPEAAGQAFRDAESLVLELSAILTDYDPESETRRLTHLASAQPTSVSEPLWEVLGAADAWYRKSDGALDCSLGSLTGLWRKYRRANRIPTQNAIDEAKKVSGWQNVRLNLPGRTVELSCDQVRLDFGAIGKGYIVDRVYDLLQKHGLNRCLVNVSGNMRLGDAPPDRSCWRVAVSPLESDGEPVRRIGLSRSAIATSGDLWQYVLIDGEKRSHILDPGTGYGVPGPLSVTAIAPSATDADALATIGCIMDWHAYANLVDSLADTEALRASQLTGDPTVVETCGFPKELVIE